MRILKADEVVGIFRVSGSDVKIRELIDRLDQGPITDWTEYNDVTAISGALKRFFRRMAIQEPLIPAELYDCFLAVMETQMGDEDRIRNLMLELLNDINPGRKKTLAYFCAYLHEISNNSEVNKMSPDNLAVCVAPNILPFPPGIEEAECLRRNALGNQAFSIMIKCYPQLFADVVITEQDICTHADIAMILGPRWDTAYVEHLIERHRLRQNSLIPYVYPSETERDPLYKRPKEVPVVNIG
jgi:hypothetical protein